MTRTKANSNHALTRAKSISLDFGHASTAIWSTVTWTRDNLNLQLTRGNFRFH